MSKFVLTAPVLAIAATAAPVSAQEQTWTGLYVGAHGVVVDADSEWDGSSVFQTIDGGEGGFTTTQNTVIFADDLSESSLGAGPRVGFNYQAGALVFGVEADASLFDYTSTTTATQGGSTYTLLSQAGNIETIRARAGFAFGPAMLFATGGVVLSDLDHTLRATNVSEVLVDGGEGGTTIGTATANLSSNDDPGTGWAIGGGGEIRLAQDVSLAFTLLHIDLGRVALAASQTPSSVGATVDTTMLVGTLGLNVSF